MSRTSRGRKIVLALVAVTAALSVAAGVGIWALMRQASHVEAGTILELELDGALTDGPSADPLAELGLGGPTASWWDLRRGLRAAADDDRIAGVLITVRQPAVGMAQLQELNTEIERYRERSGKPVHALVQTDMIDDINYYAASAASRVWVTPQAWWMVNGLQADVEFWRGTLDKLGVQPEVIMFKEYKSAGEPFANQHMSGPMREALTEVLGDLYNEWLDEVSRRRKLDRNRLQELVDQGIMSGRQAQEAGLADELGFRDQVTDALKTAAGTEAYQPLSLTAYLAKLDEDEPEGDRVALVFGEGPIYSDKGPEGPFDSGQGTIYGPELAKAIREAADDERVKAIVFRVNSPGGSAVGSDLVWREIEAAQARGKAVVVSMASVAGSGGYWVAMGSDAIVAEPTTITGSIGVVFTKLNVRGFYEWIGANVESVSFGANAGLFSPFQSFSEEQRAAVIASIGATYDEFVRKVAEGRGRRWEEIEPLAHGRIWSGRDAKEKGLIDELGGIDRAVALAAEKAGLSDPPVVVYPPPKDLLQQLFAEELGETRVDMEAWVRDLGTPRVQVLQPDIRLR